MSDKSIKLISREGHPFVVPLIVAKMSALVSSMLMDDNQDEEKEILLPNVKVGTLARVVEYCNHFVGFSFDSDEINVTVQSFYAQFMLSMNSNDLIDLSRAACVMGIQHLCYLCIEALSTVIEDLRSSTTELQKELDDTKEAILEHMSTSNAVAEADNQINAQYVLQIEMLRAAVATNEADIKTLRAERETLQLKTEKLQEALEKSKLTASEQTEGLTRKNKLIDKLKNSEDKLKIELARAVDKKNAHIHQLSSDLVSKEEERERAHKLHVQEAEKQLKEYEDILRISDQRREVVGALRSDKLDLELRLTALERTSDQRDEVIAALEADVYSLFISAALQESRNEYLESEVANLKHLLDCVS